MMGKLKADDKENLYRKDQENVDASQQNDWRKFSILCFVSYFYYQPLAMVSYIQNEWIQYSIKEDYFPGTEFSSNVSSCTNSNHSSEEYQMYTRVQQDAARWNIYVGIALHVTSFFASVIVPCYTDTYGRRFLFILTLFLFFLRLGLTSVAIYFKLSFLYIVLANAVEGLGGAIYAFLSVSFSYVADVIKDSKKRVLGVVITEAIILVPTMISGLVSGLFVDNCGYFIPSLVCTGMSFLSLLFAIFFLPETLKPYLRSKPVSVLSALKRPFEFYTSSAFSGKRLQYFLLILAFGFAITSTFNRSGIETLYLLGMPFCWTPTRIGYFSLARNAGQLVVGLGSVKLMQNFVSNEVIGITSAISCIGSLVVEALAQSELLMYMVAIIAVFGFSMIPVIRGIMSTMTPPDKQGSMFASIAAVEVIGSTVASVSENAIYSATLSFMNGFVFLVMALFVAVDLALLVCYTVINRRSRNSVIYEEFTPEEISPNPVNKENNDVSSKMKINFPSAVDIDSARS